MRIQKSLTATALALILSAPLALPAVAQVAETAPAAPSGGQLNVDEAQLEAFVAALRAVNEVEARHMTAFEGADSDEDREQVVAQANAEMVDAIDQTPGITVEDYIAVLQQAQADPSLNARIMAMLEG